MMLFKKIRDFVTVYDILEHVGHLLNATSEKDQDKFKQIIIIIIIMNILPLI